MAATVANPSSDFGTLGSECGSFQPDGAATATPRDLPPSTSERVRVKPVVPELALPSFTSRSAPAEAPLSARQPLSSRGLLSAHRPLTSHHATRRQAEMLDSSENEVRRARALVAPFLRKHGFSDVNVERKRAFQSSRFPLHAAVREQNAAMVRQLLLARADPKSADSAGRTPLDLAEGKDRNGSQIAVLTVLRPAPRRSLSMPRRQLSFIR